MDYKTFERALDARLDALPDGALRDAMVYSASRKVDPRTGLKGGGKRIRPALLMAAVSDTGGDVKEALPFAVAVELIHSYSLIHDDLPAMDDDDFRRGRPTCHRAFGEAEAILAGDALLNLSFEVMIGECQKGIKQIRATALIAKAAGAYGMVLGQSIDMKLENKTGVTFDELRKLHSLKTGALINAALCSGAVLAGIEPESPQYSVFDRLGSLLGCAFQVRDDILGATAAFEQTGKAAGGDAKNGKSTFVSLLGIDGAEGEYQKICDEIDDLYNELKLKQGAAEIRNLLDSLRFRRG